MVKVLFLSLLINFSAYSQDKISQLSSNIFNESIDSSIRSESMIKLLEIYFNPNESKNTDRIEAVLIKSTNFSSSLFFHEFELKLQDFVKNNTIEKRKGARFYLIMSKKNKDEIDYKYFKEIEKYNDKLKLLGLKKDNSMNIEIEKLLKQQKYAQVNNYYYNLILFSTDNNLLIEKCKKYYFLTR